MAGKRLIYIYGCIGLIPTNWDQTRDEDLEILVDLKNSKHFSHWETPPSENNGNGIYKGMDELEKAVLKNYGISKEKIEDINHAVKHDLGSYSIRV